MNLVLRGGSLDSRDRCSGSLTYVTFTYGARVGRYMIIRSSADSSESGLDRQISETAGGLFVSSHRLGVILLQV